MRIRFGPIVGATLLAAGAASAQGLPELAVDEPVALVADEVIYDAEARVVSARGDVEIHQAGRTLTASAVVYDAATGRLSAEGPLVLRTPDGSTILADAAEMDDALRDGVIEGARALIGGGAGALAAVEARRVDGRYTAFSKATYSSCEVCPAAPTPLWAIRARRVIHDEVERVVHYEDPVFELFGTPVAWLPYFSMPDPGVERLSGFLTPELLRASTFGLAAKAPYYWAIDPTRDVTLTPFLTTRDGVIMEGEYRQRFDLGAIQIAGSLGWLDVPGEEGVAGHVFADGVFDVGRYGLGPLGFGSGAEAGFELERASDAFYPNRFEYTDRDRLESEVFLRRFGARDFYELRGLAFQSLRDEEEDERLPLVLPEFRSRQTLDAPSALGELAFEASGVALSRVEGTDLQRLTLALDWERRAVLPAGVVARGFALARGDLYSISNWAGGEEGLEFRAAPYAGAEVAWPLMNPRPDGAAWLLEPRAQLVAAPGDVNDDVPNEDSLVVEFDEVNLFDPNRFPGYDRVEAGTRANLGVKVARIDPNGLTLDATLGRVFRLSREGSFSPGSGLADQQSDWVASWSARLEPLFGVSHRLRISEDGDINRNEALADLSYGPVGFAASYVFLEEDAQAGAVDDRSEFTLGAGLDLSRFWSVRGFWRRDLTEDENIVIEGAVAFENECAAAELYAERDFTESDVDPASTTVGLRVRLFGLADGEGPRSAVCAGRPG